MSSTPDGLQPEHDLVREWTHGLRGYLLAMAGCALPGLLVWSAGYPRMGPGMVGSPAIFDIGVCASPVLMGIGVWRLYLLMQASPGTSSGTSPSWLGRIRQALGNRDPDAADDDIMAPILAILSLMMAVSYAPYPG